MQGLFRYLVTNLIATATHSGKTTQKLLFQPYTLLLHVRTQRYCCTLLLLVDVEFQDIN